MAVSVKVQTESFDAGALLNALAGQDSSCGAVASFTGQVRGGDDLVALELEHYPGVTEQALSRIAHEAVRRWSLGEAVIIHRVGKMEIGEPIVFVGASAPHRRAALEATSFMIDILKTQAPFWKREHTTSGSNWVEPRPGDNEAASAWLAGEKENTA
ncbi:molybdenum cofactor biosynthesis protein MoaE [Maricaulis sp.]|uniref:molybdenum cofactor biosynthesis protein MoaE n=1 Tax=Maricaulis sp. TaxID=1486257 RepID=UPI003A92C732